MDPLLANPHQTKSLEDCPGIARSNPNDKAMELTKQTEADMR